MTSLQKNQPVQPGGKSYNKSRWTKKHTILIIALLSLIVAVGTMAVIIYMGLTTRTNPSLPLQRESHIKWQGQQFGPLTPAKVNQEKKWVAKKP